MPTSNQEAKQILDLTYEYLQPSAATELFDRLNTEVGLKTDSDSLKISLQMMKQLTASQPQQKISNFYVIILFLTVILHTFVVTGNSLAFFLIPFILPWYLALPIDSLIFFITLNRQLECPLTAFENYIRRKAGLPLIKTFIGHYFVKPWRNM